jgi:signal transduction histidine kinase
MGFAGCLAVGLAAMGWVSLTAVRLEQAEAKASRLSAVEENVRLALWRMDSALAPLVAQESARPAAAYSSFLPVGGGAQRPGGPRGELLLPSPLLAEPLPYVLAHFQFEPDGRLNSPRVPPAAQRRLAVPRFLSEEAVWKAEQQLAQVAALTDREQLIDMLPSQPSAPAEPVFSPLPQLPAEQAAQQWAVQQKRQTELQNFGRGQVEFSERNRAVTANANVQFHGKHIEQALNAWQERSIRPTDAVGVLMTPLWIEGRLLLARRIAVGDRECVQGCLLDWPAMQAWLLGSVDDLLPQAGLEPLPPAEAESGAHRLAALPVRLLSGPLPPGIEPLRRPVHLALVVAWGGMLLAATAVALLLAGAVRLGQRRAAFVSAVTHELRTPLTTFHMYTEMLAEGMVPEPERQEYLRTLRREAARLTHMVENVLAYARLERGRRGGPVEPVSVRQIVEPIGGRLAERAAQAGMQWVVEADGQALDAVVLANPSVVEQILFNLVDNACKYAAGAADKRIHLAIERRGEAVHVRVWDHGPGIARPAARRLFRPFLKSAREAADSAPGIGLGLALSRRLARGMGARLQLDGPQGQGACFTLVLPGGGPHAAARGGSSIVAIVLLLALCQASFGGLGATAGSPSSAENTVGQANRGTPPSTGGLGATAGSASSADSTVGQANRGTPASTGALGATAGSASSADSTVGQANRGTPPSTNDRAIALATTSAAADLAAWRTAQADPRAQNVPPALRTAALTQPQQGLEPLVRWLLAGIDNDFQKVKILHDWIAENIAYDVESFLGPSGAEPTWDAALLRGKAVCHGYAGLLAKMCPLAGIPCQVVSGHARGYAFALCGAEDLHAVNHAWNAVQVQGRWYLLDTTWDAGHVEGRSFHKQYNTAYLFLEPWQFLYTHFPSDPRWQLLDPPRTAEQFAELPYLEGRFFEQGLRLATPLRRLHPVGESVQFTIETPADRVISAQLAEPAVGQSGPLEQRTLVRREAARSNVLVTFPAAGRWCVQIFSKARRDSGPLTLAGRIELESSAGTPWLFPKTFTSAADMDAYLEGPLYVPLTTGKPQEFRIRLRGAEQVHLRIGPDRWLPMGRAADDPALYRLTADVPRGAPVQIMAREPRSAGPHWMLVDFSLPPGRDR